MSTTTKGSSSNSGRAACLESLCLELRHFLGSVKKSVNEEIHAYPTPIPRCDAQFNFLYEQRARLGHILARVETISAHSDITGEFVDTLAEFVASTPLTERGEERTLRERISAELSRLGGALGHPTDQRAVRFDAIPPAPNFPADP